jgi:DNA-binding NtrC family response regulator
MSFEETEEDVSVPKGLDRQRGRVRSLELVFVKGAPASRSYTLGAERIVLGRRPGAAGVELSDSRASREHAEITYDAEHDRHQIRDLDSRNGTHVDGARIGAVRLEDGSVVRIGDTLFVYVDATIPNGLTIPDARSGTSIARAVAEAQADLAAPTHLSILLVGPTGSGKEVMARRIHAGSGRKGPMVAVNCATFGRELIGSELFGHEAGAFSGATSKRDGLFVAARGGTLLLDEIGELPLEQQPALLRALQEKKIRPVGSDREVDVDVRVIAATHQPLDRLAKRGTFRSDLYARLAGFVVDLPGLADRKDEIIALFALFAGTEKPLSTEAAEALVLYPWPQNVRELEHAAQRAKLLSQNADTIELSALPPPVQSPLSAPKPSREVEPAAAPEERVDTLTKDELIRLLREHGGNVAKISRATGKHRQQIYRWLERDGLDPKLYRDE